MCNSCGLNTETLETRAKFPTLLQIPCVALGKSLDLSASIPHLYNRDKSSALPQREVVKINP